MEPVLISNITFCCRFIQINLWTIKKKNSLLCAHLHTDKSVHPNPRKMVAVTLKLWRDCNVEGLEQQFENNGLPFWSPQGISKMFWADMMVELPKMRQSLRESEGTRFANYLYGRDDEIRETREKSEFLNCWGSLTCAIVIKCLSCSVRGYSLNLIFLSRKSVTLGKFLYL